MNEPKSEIHYPFILLRVAGGLYCVNSRYVSSIMELPSFQPLPDAPPYITGIFPYRDKSITMFDLRTALNLQTLSEEFEEFHHMLEERKQDHLRWVKELERCALDGEKFTLATDPHECALGRWYDKFKEENENQAIGRILVRLEDPHQKLHGTVKRSEACVSNGDCVEQVLREAKHSLVPQILDILDQARDVFRDTIYHEMVLILDGKDTTLGLVVDEVLGVEELQMEEGNEEFQKWRYTPYVTRIVRSPNYEELILEINMPYLMSIGSQSLGGTDAYAELKLS